MRNCFQMIFPCEVTYADGGFAKDAKVFVFDDGLAVYTQQMPAEPTLLSWEPWDEARTVNPHAPFSMQVITTPGGTIVRRGMGCGCSLMGLKALGPQQVRIP